MSDLNIRYSNCFDFINETKRYLEANPTDWRNIYTMEDLAYAECDLMEMELEADYDTEEYDALLNGNVFRSSKRAQRRKANKKHHKADRYHGKNYLKRNNLQKLSMEDAEFFHDKKAMDIACHDGKWIYTGKDGNNFWSKVWYTRHKKNRNDRLNSAMDAREKDLLAFDDLFDKSQLVVKQAKKETDPIRKTQLWDLDKNLTDAMCVDFYADLSMTPERF